MDAHKRSLWRPEFKNIAGFAWGPNIGHLGDYITIEVVLGRGQSLKLPLAVLTLKHTFNFNALTELAVFLMQESGMLSTN